MKQHRTLRIAFALALLAYPRAFRRRFGDEMRRDFERTLGTRRTAGTLGTLGTFGTFGTPGTLGTFLCLVFGFSACGDFSLSFECFNFFLGGLVSFLLAHVIYIV